jgi:hypothetical protein
VKHLKLFEEWSPNLGYNESEKEQLKTDYEKYVMSKDYIPNMIRDLFNKHMSGDWTNWKDIDGSPMKLDVTWEPEPFKDLAKQKGMVKKKEFNDVTYAGRLTLKSDFANTPIRYNGRGEAIAGGDYRMVLGERFDMILVQATKLLPLDLPPRGQMDDSSHGPISFRQIDNTYTLKQEFDKPNQYKAIFGLILDKVYLEI